MQKIKLRVVTDSSKYFIQIKTGWFKWSYLLHLMFDSEKEAQNYINKLYASN